MKTEVIYTSGKLLIQIITAHYDGRGYCFTLYKAEHRISEILHTLSKNFK